MQLTREQIERIYQAMQDNGAEMYYVEEDTEGKLRFGAVEMIEKRKPIALTKAPAKS